MSKAKPKRTWWTRFLENLRLRTAPLGNRGETYAARYLRKQGFKILARNRTLGGGGKGEIDIIAIDKTFLVFVEVRTRSSEEFMTPEHSLHFKNKQKTLRTTIRRLIQKHGRAGLTPRLDVVAIIWPNGAKNPSDIRHHRAAIALAEW